MRRLEENLSAEEGVLVTEDGEEFSYRGDPLDLIFKQWRAGVEGRPVEHPLEPYVERGLRLKHPSSVSDPLWRMLDGQAVREVQ